MSKQIDGFITWVRSFLDDVYAPKGSGGSDLDIDFVPKSENENGVICFSGGLTYDLDKVYPVGSIYMSVNSTNPSTLFGGTWVQLTDTFLYATSTTADDNVTTAPSGQGSKDAVVVEHTHTQNAHSHDAHHSAFVESTQNFGITEKWNVTHTSGGTGFVYSTLNPTLNRSTHTASTTATNQNTGESGTGKNMPPYMKVFMWKRTE